MNFYILIYVCTVYVTLGEYEKETVFIIHDNYYGDWTRWSACSKDCAKFRSKHCKDISSTFCPVSIIKEIASCHEKIECENQNVLYSIETLDVLPKFCGKSLHNRHIKNKIIGGKSADKNSWPWMVSYGFWKGNNLYIKCGASLISNEWAITAAHCINHVYTPFKMMGNLIKVEDKKVFLRIGGYHKSKINLGEYYVFISYIAIHPQYSNGDHHSNYDFALLKLKKPIESNFNMTYPCISSDQTLTLPASSTCFALGWGKQGNDNTKNKADFDDRLQEVQLPLLSFETCKLDYTNIYINYTIHICAGIINKDTCSGDSGGGLYCIHPVTKRWLLYGIISFGTSKGCGQVSGVYARVSAAIEWIDKTLKTTVL